jgi:hypothetical protein
MNSSLSFKIVLACGVLIEVSCLVLTFLSPSYGNIPVYMFIYFEAFLLFFTAWFFLKKTEGIKINIFRPVIKKLFRADEETTAKLTFPFIIVLFGILFRITLIPSAPATSPDIYRYMFEGRTTLSGHNPYLVTPADERLAGIRDENNDKVMFKNIPAIYPPLSQGIFALSQVFTPGSYISIKIIFFLFEIITLFILLKFLLLKGKNPNLVLLYAWLPLPVFEYFVNAHIDAAGLCFLLMFVYLFEKGKTGISAIPFTLAVLTKLYPLMLFPLFFKKISIKKLFIFGFIFASIAVLFYLPFVYNNIYVVESLVKYMQHWEFNGSVYNLVKLVSNGQTARQVCSALLIVTIIVIAFKYTDFTKGVFGVFIAYIIFASTLYPWYLGWAAVLNPFTGFASVMSLFFTSNFSNFTPLAPKWQEFTWVLLLQYVPFFGLLIYDLRKKL